MANDVLEHLMATIEARRTAAADASYTRQLLDGGAEKCARKFGEEAIETIVAGLKGDQAELAAEAADVVYHLMVLLACRDVRWTAVEEVLAARTSMSGVDEKSSRTKAKSAGC